MQGCAHITQTLCYFSCKAIIPSYLPAFLSMEQRWDLFWYPNRELGQMKLVSLKS